MQLVLCLRKGAGLLANTNLHNDATSSAVNAIFISWDQILTKIDGIQGVQFRRNFRRLRKG